MRSLSLEWDVGYIIGFCALEMGLEALTMVGREIEGINP
jgi:hypothetical protein